MFSRFSLILIASCVIVCSKSENVTRCEDCDILELYKKFVYNVVELDSKYVTRECNNALNEYWRGLKNLEKDAVKSIYLRLIIKIRKRVVLILVFDATAKIPSGILRGNVNQYGDFDECLSIENAQYCLAEINLQPLWKEPYIKFQKEVHSYFVFREEFEDVS